MSSPDSSPEHESVRARDDDDEPDSDSVEPSILAKIVRDMVGKLATDPDLAAELVATLREDGITELLSSSSRTEAAIRESVRAAER